VTQEDVTSFDPGELGEKLNLDVSAVFGGFPSISHHDGGDVTTDRHLYSSLTSPNIADLTSSSLLNSIQDPDEITIFIILLGYDGYHHHDCKLLTR
jgi:hypothetical protein